MTRVLILNGPNLGQLGVREPSVYGTETLDDLAHQLQTEFRDHEIEARQTDSEAEMLSWLHSAMASKTPVVLNAGAWTHYSYAVRDAVSMITSAGTPVIEVHISNPHAREEFRHTSVLTAVSTGVIAGFGFDSYRLAVTQLIR
ncbi:type II 3-dehydroquinate dehydratase [Paramicrobacterium sp. CJ85]|uniref:type II 3-dehydroquinate dehydratase n=1 Tax=Paramicrobacterium sp. CJ85 TaxID=3445355 RepID=UPI003F603D7B